MNGHWLMQELVLWQPQRGLVEELKASVVPPANGGDLQLDRASYGPRVKAQGNV